MVGPDKPHKGADKPIHDHGRTTMYTETNYRTKKALREAVAAGERVATYQPGALFPPVTDGVATLEGPHYPAPHTWYATVILEGGYVVKVAR
jgi:hypothetical protein